MEMNTIGQKNHQTNKAAHRIQHVTCDVICDVISIVESKWPLQGLMFRCQGLGYGVASKFPSLPGPELTHPCVIAGKQPQHEPHHL